MTRFRQLISTRQVAFALVALLVAMLLAPMAGHALAANATATVNSPKLNVRSGPGPGYGVVEVVSQGNIVTLLGRNADSSWAKVRLASTKEGWASTFYLVTDVSWSSLPVITEDKAPTLPTGYVNTPSVNMRKGPSPQYDVIMTLGYGHLLNLVGRDTTGSWVEVTTNGVKGWVDVTYVTTSASIMALPDTSASVPPPGTSPTPGPGGGTPIPPNQSRGMVISQRLNVRTGPGAGNTVITTVEYGDILPLLARNTDGSWVRVQVDAETRGWVSSLYILISEPFKLSDLPITAEVEPSATVITGSLHVRSGPGPQYASVGTLNYGTVIGVVGRNADGSWVKISVFGMKGWVDPSYLAIDFQIASLPVVNQ
jgi:N-acetylmuramoyl-L-alanine amidase